METTTTLLPQIIAQTGLNESNASIITERFADYEAKAAEWHEKAQALTITSESQKTEMKMAREGRLFLRQLRLNVEATRKELKEEYLQGGRGVDHIAKYLVSLISPIEDFLQAQETFAARAIAKRKEALRIHRHGALAPYTADPSIYALADLSEEGFLELLNGFVLAKQAREEAAMKAEAARLAAEKDALLRLAAEAKAHEEQRSENERLRKEATIAATALAAEREAVEQARLKAEWDAAEQRMAVQARLNAERKILEAAAAVERAAAAAELQKERDAAEALRRVAAEQAAAKKAAADKLAVDEAATERKRLAAEKKMAAAPDREKLALLIASIEVMPLPTLETAEAKEIISNVRGLLGKVTNYIASKAESL